MNAADLRFVRIPVGELETNAWLLHAAGCGDCLLVDPGADAAVIRTALDHHGLAPALVLLTHCHIDHTGAVADLLRDFPVPLAAHTAAARHLASPFNAEMAAALGLKLPPAADRLLENGEVLHVAGLSWTVIHTPGHSPGSICLRSGDTLVSGDTLFAGSIGRTDLPGGDFASIQESLEQLRSLPPGTRILPGHGEPTTMERELRFNPFL